MQKSEQERKEVKAVVSSCPCYISCWIADGDECHCECGGKYHGVYHYANQKDLLDEALRKHGITPSQLDESYAELQKRIEKAKRTRAENKKEAKRIADEINERRRVEEGARRAVVLEELRVTREKKEAQRKAIIAAKRAAWIELHPCCLVEYASVTCNGVSYLCRSCRANHPSWAAAFDKKEAEKKAEQKAQKERIAELKHKAKERQKEIKKIQKEKEQREAKEYDRRAHLAATNGGCTKRSDYDADWEQQLWGRKIIPQGKFILCGDMINGYPRLCLRCERNKRTK
jgi:hypothetical protein